MLVSSLYLTTNSSGAENDTFAYHLEGLRVAQGQAQEFLQSQLENDLDGSDADSSSDSGDEENTTDDIAGREIRSLSVPASIVEDIVLYISCLMNLLPTIESVLEIPLPQEQPLANTTPLQVSSFASPYIHQIRDKFKVCDIKLAERLGEANWQRHKMIRLHMDKKEEIEHEADTSKTTFTPVSLFHDSGYATTSASNNSFLTTQTESNSDSLRVPETPQEVAAGKPFTCPICNHRLKNIRSRSDWK